MAVSIRQQSAVDLGINATSNPVALPSAPISGNLLVYLVAVDKEAGTFTAGAGFTLRSSTQNASVSIAISTKISDGSETGEIAPVSWATGRLSKAVLLELQSSSGDVEYDNQINNITTSSVTTLGTGTVTAGANAAFAITLMGKDSAKAAVGDPAPTATWSNGFTTFAEDWNSTDGHTGFSAASSVISSGSVSSTFSHDGSADQLACAIVTFTETGGGGGGGVSIPVIQHHRLRH